MKAVIQRVRSASVTAAGREVARIGSGLVALVGFSAQETPATTDMPRIARRILTLRIFDDDAGRLNQSLEEVQGELLVIPQITLMASLTNGTRPSFHTAASPKEAKALYEALVSAIKAVYPHVSIGIFQAEMVVALENDGPVTFVLENP